MEKKFTWIPFYRELAKKLLEFKNNRSDLVKIVYELDEKYVNFINNHDKSQVFDIDFFSLKAHPQPDSSRRAGNRKDISCQTDCKKNGLLTK